MPRSVIPSIRFESAPPDAVVGTIDLLPITDANGVVTDHVVVRAAGRGSTLLFGELAGARGRRVSEAAPAARSFVSRLLDDDGHGAPRVVDLRLFDRLMRVFVGAGPDGIITIVFARFDAPAHVAPEVPTDVRIARLLAMMSVQSDGVGLYEPVRGPDGTITDFRCLEITDADITLAPSEQIGRTILELFPEAGSNGVVDGYRQVMETGEPWTPDPIVYDFQGQRYHYRVRAAAVDGYLVVAWRDTLVERDPEGLEPTGEPLTARQLEILRRIGDGGTSAEIASALFLSPFTVRNDVRRIFTKLGVRTRAEAVRTAISKGVLASRPDGG